MRHIPEKHTEEGENGVRILMYEDLPRIRHTQHRYWPISMRDVKASALLPVITQRNG